MTAQALQPPLCQLLIAAGATYRSPAAPPRLGESYVSEHREEASPATAWLPGHRSWACSSYSSRCQAGSVCSGLGEQRVRALGLVGFEIGNPRSLVRFILILCLSLHLLPLLHLPKLLIFLLPGNPHIPGR